MENLNDFVYKNISQCSDNRDCGNSKQHSCQYFEHYSAAYSLQAFIN